MFDAIYADSFGRWGGRFSLIVPCENGEVRPAYLPWITAYDPDIIYSYVDLADDVVGRLHEKIGPAFLVRHRSHHKERDQRAYRPNLPVAPLSVVSVAAILAKGGMLSAARPVAIIDTHLGARPSQFLQDNFGCYNQSLSPWPIGQDMTSYLSATIYVPENIQSNPRMMPRAQGEIVASEEELIERISTQRDLRGLTQLSACLAPRLEVSGSAWTRTVNVVVGDSFEDNVIFWNARHHVPVWLDGGIVTLKISPSDVDDPKRFASLVGIFKNRIYFPVGGNASHSEFVFRSTTAPEGKLREIRDRFHAENRFNTYAIEALSSMDAVVPTPETLEHARDHVEVGSPFQPMDWHEQSVADDVFRPMSIAPRHIRDASQVPAAAKQGIWGLDIDIERVVNHSGVQNIQHRWRFPRRLRMVGGFLRGYQLSGMSPVCMPRSTAHGLLSIACGVEGTTPEVNIPTDEGAFRYGLCARRDWWPFTSGDQRPKPGVALDIRPSDKGRYLTALLRMSGSIHRATEIFLSKFWLDQFETLGATPKATDARVEAVVATLKKRLKGGQIENADEWMRLAKTVLAEARAERSPSRYLRFDKLSSDFEAFRNAFWATRQAGAPRSEWDDRERKSLAGSVKYLCEIEILHQGHEWRCRQCYNNNWVSIAAMNRLMVCEVCGNSRPAPVADPWYFRLNGFVAEGLREHGLLPVLWCLANCAQQAKASLFYLEPHELFLENSSLESGKPDAEIDLLVVADGKVRLCEAKASGHDIDLVKLANLAKRVRPDVVTLAVMEPMSRSLGRKLDELRTLLSGTEIIADLMSLHETHFDDSPNLPSGTSVRVSLF